MDCVFGMHFHQDSRDRGKEGHLGQGRGKADIKGTYEHSIKMEWRWRNQ